MGGQGVESGEHEHAAAGKTMPRHRIHVQELHLPSGSSGMSRLWRRVTVALLVVAALAVAAIFFGPHAISVAQQPQTRQPPNSISVAQQQPQQQQQRPAAAGQKAPAQQQPQAPSTPQRIETVIYDAWTVVCRDTVEKSSKKSCSALNRVVEPKSQQVLFVWRMDTDAQGRLIARLQTPTGVQIQRGVEVKFGNADARRFMFTVCDARSCHAEALVDDQLLKESMAAPEGLATVVLRDGRALQFKWSMKGYDKAIASLRSAR